MKHIKKFNQINEFSSYDLTGRHDAQGFLSDLAWRFESMVKEKFSGEEKKLAESLLLLYPYVWMGVRNKYQSQVQDFMNKLESSDLMEKRPTDLSYDEIQDLEVFAGVISDRRATNRLGAIEQDMRLQDKLRREKEERERGNGTM